MLGFKPRILALAKPTTAPLATVSSAVNLFRLLAPPAISASLIASLGLMFYVTSSDVRAQGTVSTTIAVEQPWARATPKGTKMGAAFMTLVNNGASAERLLGATTPLAEHVQFHQETEEKGVSRMRELKAVDIKPGGKIIFKPGEMHVMIVGLKQPLIEGQTFPLTLQFEKAGIVEVTVPVQKIGATEPGHIGHEGTGHEGMGHEGMGSMTH
jgi:periplasmic copper chaperone A